MILAWGDVLLGKRFLTGFRLLEDLDDTGVFLEKGVAEPPPVAERGRKFSFWALVIEYRLELQPLLSFLPLLETTTIFNFGTGRRGRSLKIGGLDKSVFKTSKLDS